MTSQEFLDIRHGLQLSQWQLARVLNVRPETISRRERGHLPISVKLAQRLLDLAGLAKCPTCGQPMP